MDLERCARGGHARSGSPAEPADETPVLGQGVEDGAHLVLVGEAVEERVEVGGESGLTSTPSLAILLNSYLVSLPLPRLRTASTSPRRYPRSTSGR